MELDEVITNTHRWVCNESGERIRLATFSEIIAQDQAHPTNHQYTFLVDSEWLHVDGEPLVGYDVHDRVAVWSTNQGKMVDARYASNRELGLASISIGGRIAPLFGRWRGIKGSIRNEFENYLELTEV